MHDKALHGRLELVLILLMVLVLRLLLLLRMMARTAATETSATSLASGRLTMRRGRHTCHAIGRIHSAKALNLRVLFLEFLLVFLERTVQGLHAMLQVGNRLLHLQALTTGALLELRVFLLKTFVGASNISRTLAARLGVPDELLQEESNGAAIRIEVLEESLADLLVANGVGGRGELGKECLEGVLVGLRGRRRIRNDEFHEIVCSERLGARGTVGILIEVLVRAF